MKKRAFHCVYSYATPLPPHTHLRQVNSNDCYLPWRWVKFHLYPKPTEPDVLRTGDSVGQPGLEAITLERKMRSSGWWIWHMGDDIQQPFRIFRKLMSCMSLLVEHSPNLSSSLPGIKNLSFFKHVERRRYFHLSKTQFLKIV